MGLAYIGTVEKISAIPNADRVVSAEANCGQGGRWRGVIRKGEMEEGDKCLVFLPDAIVPQRPEYDFMEKYGWRVVPRRFRGAPSECLIVPVPAELFGQETGDDVTELLGVKKYEKPIPPSLAGRVVGPFPAFIPKTDEPNYRGVPDMVLALGGNRYYATVKVDGASATVYEHDGHFGCCSRNWELAESDSNAIWQIARRYGLREILDGLALQFEVAGPSIRENPMGLSQVTPFLFNVYDIRRRCYWNGWQVRALAECIKMPFVDVVVWDDVFPVNASDSWLDELARGNYPNGRPREGIVIRPMGEMMVGEKRLSFKVLNLDYE